jgi:hypothetical protein
MPTGLTIGGNPGRYFQGSIANAALYSSTLSAAQVASHYQAGSEEEHYESVVLASSPMAFYPLSDWSPIVGPTPVNVSPPAISSSPVVGFTTQTTNGIWTGYPAPNFTYQWEDCNTSGQSCTAIAGATAQSYTPTSADVGDTLRVTVTATNSAGSASETSAQSAVVSAT